MALEIKPAVKYWSGIQEDGSIVVEGLSQFHSSLTLIEFQQDGFTYYLGEPGEVTCWVHALLPYVRFEEAEKEAQRSRVESGLNALETNPRAGTAVQLSFQYTDARPFSDKNHLRFMNRGVLNDTFVGLLPLATHEGWFLNFPKFHEEVLQTVSPNTQQVLAI